MCPSNKAVLVVCEWVRVVETGNFREKYDPYRSDATVGWWYIANVMMSPTDANQSKSQNNEYTEMRN
jgi:hypothetical protein